MDPQAVHEDHPAEAKAQCVPDSAWLHVMWHAAKLSGGITMVPYRPRRPVDKESLAEVIGIWKANAPMSGDEFYAAYDKRACSDWSKMQPDGAGLGAAREATRRANGKALAALPYPPQTVLYAIDYLCPRRCESVPRVADWLAWIRAEARAAHGAELPLIACEAGERGSPASAGHPPLASPPLFFGGNAALFRRRV